MPSPIFPVALTAGSHRQAEQIRDRQPNSARAQQAYLNALAQFAVDHYLQCMGIISQDCPNRIRDITSQHVDLTLAALSEATPLSIGNLGQLECCALLPGDQKIFVPPEARFDRIGYVVVQLESSLKTAEVLGFARKLDEAAEVLPVNELASLEVLLHHLHQLAHPSQLALINLTHWFQNRFDQGWQIYSDLHRSATLKPAMGFRGPCLTGRKAIVLDSPNHQPMDLVMTLVQRPDHRTRIEIQVISPESKPLPRGLTLSVLDDQGKTFTESCLTQAISSLAVQPFTGAAGEKFAIKLRLEETEFQEYFIA